MKIIFITRESYELPAARIRCYGFAKKLNEYGLETEVLSYADNLKAKFGEEERFMSWFKKARLNLQAFKRLYSKTGVLFLQRFNYHAFAPIFLKHLKRCKMIFDVDDWEARESVVYYNRGWSSSKAEMAMRLIAKTSQFCIGASRFLVDYLSCYSDKVLYMPTGVDINLFQPTSIDKEKNGSIILSWVGTMHRPDNVENIQFLIRCFQDLSYNFDNIILEIVGSGIYVKQVEFLVKQSKNINIKLRPWLKPQDMPDYLRNVDIGIMPLIQNTKFNKAKSPTRIFEYMAMEKPVVVSDIGESRYVVKDGVNGLLAGDKSEFVSKLSDLIKDTKLRKNIGKSARKTVVERYSLDVLGKRLFEGIEKL